jgi:hypothetical protein
VERARSASADVSEFKPLLRPGETLLWLGKPDTRLGFKPMDWVLIPFGFVFLAFSVMWTITAFRGACCVGVVGFPFLFIGYQLCIGRIFSDARLRRYTTYLLTSRRLLVVCRRPKKMENVLGEDLADIARIDLSLHRDGRGSIAYSSGTTPKDANGGIKLWPSEELNGLFQYIDDPLEVLRQIRAAIGDARPPTAPQPILTAAPAGAPHSTWFDADETPLWTGQPKPRGLFRATDLVAVVFALLWLGGIVLMFRARLNKAGPRGGPLTPFEMMAFGLFFGLGLYLAIAALIGNFFQRGTTWYAVTSDRVVILSGRRGQRFTSLRRDAIYLIELKEHSDGTGTLTFNAPPPQQARRRGHGDPPSFERIENAEDVKRLIRPPSLPEA